MSFCNSLFSEKTCPLDLSVHALDGIKQRWRYHKAEVHLGSRDHHPASATLRRRSPDARSGVRPGQILVFLALVHFDTFGL